ncbi:MAG: iron-containing alcohol dehydrogenase [Defluviitaleaceae bacterium]|nr:iron-containing alcohol dehydrogenase [Defluviitaleaceae bacterium]
MKALILNSGTGSRMKNLVTCKCLMELEKGVTILDAQIQAILRSGITDICITTGPHADILENHARKNYPKVSFTFVNNPLYDQTNYIYSIYLAREHLLGDEMLILHGDLVFEQNVLHDIIESLDSVMVVDSTKPLPEKDFKAMVQDSRVIEVSTTRFESTLYAQPLYRLRRHDWYMWLKAITAFCKQGRTNVYAEEALNGISEIINLYPFDIAGRACFEVDNQDDLKYAQEKYQQFPEKFQAIYTGHYALDNIKDVLSKAKKPLIVCEAWAVYKLSTLITDSAVYFTHFTPNPTVEEVMAGIELLEKENCDFIVSVGGGSAIDTAKSINILNKEMPRACHLAIPTTAGTGSESTCFAVIYENGEKLSIEHQDIRPQHVILDAILLNTLPIYHKKSALLDALCQSIESLWAKGQTVESKSYALASIHLIFAHYKDYIGDDDLQMGIFMLQAANLSGKAINISKTTAPHAMSYKLSTLFDIAHGHAVALCLPPVWKHLQEINAVPDTLTQEYYDTFMRIVAEFNLEFNYKSKLYSLAEELAADVNTQRLNNHPVALSQQVLADMYRSIGEII